jgi:ribosome hibernation promoting factor
MGAHAAPPYTFGVNLILSGRGVSLDEPLRRYATEKLTRVERFFDRIIKMEVELLTHERNRNGQPHRVEVTVQTPRETLRAHGDGIDHFAAIDKAADRLETQLRKLKERLREHPHRQTKAELAVPNEVEEEPTVVRRPQQVSKPLSVEEAQLELESRGLGFMLFTDAETMQPAVIYRRPDGRFGVVDYAS